jgi:acetolactate synthase-1/3 small subunit
VGLLSQIRTVFTHRNVNIESITASESAIDGIYKHTIMVRNDEEKVANLVKQIEKKIDVLQANYFVDEEIYQHEIALYKLSNPEFQNNPEASKIIRRHSARIVEVNPVYCIVEKNGMSEEITELYAELSELNCVLQFVRSGRVAITKSNFERVNEYLDYREEKYRKQKKESNE